MISTIPSINNISNENMNSSNINYFSSERQNLALSETSEKVHIDGNLGWVSYKAAGNCTGSGTYSDPYIIKDLKIDGEGSGSCILIENSNVYFKIEGCIVYNSGTNWDDAGIKLYQTTNGAIINNNCSHNCNGILLNTDCVNNTIQGNLINSGTWLAGILLPLVGIQLVNYCVNNTILGNSILNNYNYIGISLDLCDNNSILENHVNNNQNGIWLSDGMNSLILGNQIVNNSYNGIYIKDGNNNTISRNIVKSNNYRGIFLDTTNGSIVFLNCLIKNALNAYDDGINNQWHNGAKGNYWGDYAGSDDNGDGIGDVPYLISRGNQDNFPLMNCPLLSQKGGIIQGYDLFLLLGILAVVSIFICKKLKKS